MSLSFKLEFLSEFIHLLSLLTRRPTRLLIQKGSRGSCPDLIPLRAQLCSTMSYRRPRLATSHPRRSIQILFERFSLLVLFIRLWTQHICEFHRRPVLQVRLATLRSSESSSVPRRSALPTCWKFSGKTTTRLKVSADTPDFCSPACNTDTGFELRVSMLTMLSNISMIPDMLMLMVFMLTC